jgi:transcriptional regulator with XRE-family HTH domain
LAAGHDARYRKLIAALKIARKKAGITQIELAERLGTRQQFVSKVESCERRLDVVELVDIGHALGLDVAALVAEIPPSSLA